ncbi:MAG: nitroreductase family protein [Spirochaetia bacterium]
MEKIIGELEKRRAYRALSKEKIDRGIINTLLSAAVLAPSCFNNQPWRFLVADSEETLSVVKEHLAGGNYWMQKAPAIVLVAANPDDDCRLSGSRDYALFDTGMAAMGLILQAVREGLHAHPIAGFKSVELKRALGIPEEYILITCVALGYPGNGENLSDSHKKAETSPRERKDISEVVFFNSWPK